jgi:hypothetical protein
MYEITHSVFNKTHILLEKIKKQHTCHNPYTIVVHGTPFVLRILHRGLHFNSVSNLDGVQTGVGRWESQKFNMDEPYPVCAALMLPVNLEKMLH